MALILGWSQAGPSTGMPLCAIKAIGPLLKIASVPQFLSSLSFLFLSLRCLGVARLLFQPYRIFSSGIFFLSSWYCPSALSEGISGREAGKGGSFFVSLSVYFLQANSFWQEGSFLGELTLEPGAALTGTVGVPLPL